MAAISAETEAILDRLKAEGQLTRNSGTNSIRSVNIQLTKFDKVFSTISSNITKQTIMMRQMSNIQEEALEAAKRKEDFDEITNSSSSRSDSSGSDSSSSSNETNEKVGKGILGFLSGLSGLAKLGGVAAGTFILGNLLKGYVDEKFDGAFTKGLADIKSAFGLGEGGLNFEDLRAQFTSMTTQLGNVATSLTNLNTKFESMLLKMDEIMAKIDEFSLSWDSILGWATGLISGLTLLGIGVRSLNMMSNRKTQRMIRSMALDEDYEKQQQRRNRYSEQRNNLLRRTLNNMRRGFGLAPLTDTPIVDPETGRRPVYDDAIMRQQRTGRVPTTPAPQTRPSGRYDDQILRQQRLGTPRSSSVPSVTSTGTNRTFSAAEVRQDASRSLKGYSLANNGNSLRGPNGQMVSGQAALDALESTLDPKYSRIFRRITQFVRITGWAALVLMAFEVAMILADENMTDEQKKKAIARIFLVGATAALFAAAGAAVGSIVPGWGTLIGGLVGGIGGFFAADYVMDSIIEALWGGGNPEQERLRELERESFADETAYFGSEEGQAAKRFAIAESRAMAGHNRPIDSGGNPMDDRHVPDDIKRILSGSKRNYFQAADGTFYGTVPGSGQNLRYSQIAPADSFLESKIREAQAGAVGSVPPVVLNNIRQGDINTFQTTKMGDQNVADVQVVNGGGNGDSNPLALSH